MNILHTILSTKKLQTPKIKHHESHLERRDHRTE